MKNFGTPLRLLLGAALAVAGGQAVAQSAGMPMPVPPVIYPAKGQGPQQQDRDRYECHDWARAQSGYDPTRAQPMPAGQASATPPVTGSQAEQAARMAKGAMGGAAMAELTHNDAGRGAAAGALGAVVLQQIKQHSAQQQSVQRAAAMQAAARSQQRTTYERALAACLEGRGYVVK
jgi:hypothetical protein